MREPRGEEPSEKPSEVRIEEVDCAIEEAGNSALCYVAPYNFGSTEHPEDSWQYGGVCEEAGMGVTLMLSGGALRRDGTAGRMSFSTSNGMGGGADRRCASVLDD